MSIGSFLHKAETFDYIHPSQFISVRKSVSPSRGAGGLGQGLSHGLGQGVGQGVRVLCVICLPFWYDGCQMRLEPVFRSFGKPRGILYFIVEHTS